ncbi:MAG: sugar-phosphate isomerase, RpiB/LacA/LacB family [Candidatus Magasanikbacteria bacterium]|nr:sugar-phosphate isomerase, RpiB/LacA/LacB family [Candidatus Magasanikbacteria bacterium]
MEQKSPIILATDHAGFVLKESIKEYLKFLGMEVEDMGATQFKEDDDYPDYASPAAKKVAAGGAEARGIFFCGNAVGVCMIANKTPGIRAAVGFNTAVAKTSRTDDDTNVLCLPGRILSKDFARAIVRLWIETPFSGEERHIRRLAKVAELDQKK